MGNHKLSISTRDHSEELGSRKVTNKTARAIPIVCLGMSAGGIDALKPIIEGLSPNTGMAFVVITHLSPGAKTHLPGLLSRWCNMPVEVVQRGRVIRPNHVYVMPAGQEMIVRDGWFSLGPKSKTHGYPNVITLFLESLTRHRKPPGIAVILSGIDADGAAALEAFGLAGGLAIAQSPASAQFPDMPRSAIGTGFVNYVLSPEEIPGQIEVLGRYLTSGEAPGTAA